MPSALRDLFGFRLALRCNTPQASDTILGQGWASAGADASTIPGAQRGVGYLLAEGERPIRLRGFYLDDDDVHGDRRARRRAPRRRLARGRRRGRAGGARHDRDRHPREPACSPTCSSAPRTRRSGSASSASCARRATAGGRSGCAGSVDAIDRATGEVVRVVLDRARARRDAAEVLRQPPRGGLPVVRARPTAATRSSSSPPGCAAARASPSRSPSTRWCSLTLTAPSFGPVHSRRVGRRQGAALPAAPRRRASARTACRLVVRRGPRRGRPAARRAALPGVLRLRARGAVERAGARAVAPHGDPAPARARAADRRHAAASCATRARVLRQGRRVPAPRRAALPLRPAPRPAHRRGRRASRRRRRVHGAQLLDRRVRPRPRGTCRSSPPRRTRRRADCPASRPRRRARSAGARRSRSASSTPRRRRRGVVRGLHRQVRDQVHRGGRRADVPARRRRPRSGCKVRPHVAPLRRVRVAARRRAAPARSCGCGAGRTRSASAGTASPRAAATRRRSRALRQARHEHQLRRRTAASGATRGAGR